jgi:hypothetical protein
VRERLAIPRAERYTLAAEAQALNRVCELVAAKLVVA